MAGDERTDPSPRGSHDGGGPALGANLIRALRAGLVLAALALCGAPGVGAREEISREYQVKAAFLFNFVQFVDWPRERFADAQTPICIGILGEDPFGSVLEDLLRGEKVRDRAFAVRRSATEENLGGCHVVFVSQSERDRTRRILPALADKSILTVGEVEGFASAGGIINFRIEGNRVRFEINPAAAEREGLKISSQLLSLGTIVAAER